MGTFKQFLNTKRVTRAVSGFEALSSGPTSHIFLDETSYSLQTDEATIAVISSLEAVLQSALIDVEDFSLQHVTEASEA
jgi:hypothetical protein